MPSMISIVVVLPAPLGPSSPKQIPRGTEKLTPSTAFTLPYALWRSRTSIIGSITMEYRQYCGDRIPVCQPARSWVVRWST